MDLQKALACSEIDKYTKELNALGSRIWKYSERPCREEKSAKAICLFLKKHGFKVTPRYRRMATAFRADFGEKETGGRDKPNIAILCRYDADRQGHMNGNNLVAEMAVGAGLGVSAVLQASSTPVGRVTVFGCPNSANGGAISLLNLRGFGDVDIAFTAAPGSRTEWTPTYRGSRTLRAIYKAMEAPPERPNEDGGENGVTLATNAVDAVVLAQTNLQTIREHFPHSWKVTGTVKGGTDVFKKPTECSTTVKMTAPSNKEISLMDRRVTLCLEAAAIGTGCEMDVVHAEKPYYSFITNTPLTYLLQLNAYYCGILSTPLKARVMMDSVDVANISHVIPTIRPIFYIGTDAEPGTKEFRDAANTTEAHAYALSMAKTLAMTVVDVLHSASTLAAAKQALQEEVEAERRTHFTPFPGRPDHSYKLQTEIPCSDNVGWSKIY